MQLTLQTGDIRRFHEILSWIVRSPKNTGVHFITFRGEASRPEESKGILLARSKYEGDAYVLRMNREHLRQALSLGCLDFRFGTSYPFASTENVRLCWMPLDTCGALPLESECPRNPAVLLRSDESVIVKKD